MQGSDLAGSGRRIAVSMTEFTVKCQAVFGKLDLQVMLLELG
jgi:hypothetical protein